MAIKECSDENNKSTHHAGIGLDAGLSRSLRFWECVIVYWYKLREEIYGFQHLYVKRGKNMNVQIEYSQPELGFIGMGNMGRRMALRLLDTSYALTVYDRTPSKTQPVVQKGARVAETPAAVAAAADIVLSCVTDNAALEAVMLGPTGALAGARPGTICIEMSTVSPHLSRHLAQLAQERGVHMIDAAVSGSVPQAEAGKLVIFVGGTAETYHTSLPLLRALGNPQYLGANGMGVSMKLVANALLGLSLEALAEVLALGEKAGLEREQLISVLKQTALVSPRQKVALEDAEQQAYPAHFPLPLMGKDFDLIGRLASQLTVPMPATAAAQQMYAIAEAWGVKDDAAAIIEVMKKLVNVAE